jgi:hypothetical protein
VQEEFKEAMLTCGLHDGNAVIRGGTVSVVDMELIDAVGIDHFRRCFYLGNVQFVEPLGNRRWCSLVPKSNEHYVFIRGTKILMFRFCERCRDFPKYVHGYGTRFDVIDSDVSSREVIYPSMWPSFLIRGDYLQRIDPFKQKKLIHVNRIPIVGSPMDGLPLDLFSLPRDFRIV